MSDETIIFAHAKFPRYDCGAKAKGNHLATRVLADHFLQPQAKIGTLDEQVGRDSGERSTCYCYPLFRTRDAQGIRIDCIDGRFHFSNHLANSLSVNIAGGVRFKN